ncbi:hypothetical protein PPERSA_07246 [Pseudocohnilembus persalinus]|uniref:Fungal lipase-type domain-containing protein n=1 Tax=Pseudocohnilembus persalinus TaxID=266149 RepID=A0A0V0QCU9_PSEPJ|nr:hypothetical protein PPERSA_07246 [Pseudocohnilembus persalinus]|eukprot:KRX00049.1 hypothetical protein PPERSA_07246 [Pseudocohnilembus persalinus]
MEQQQQLQQQFFNQKPNNQKLVQQLLEKKYAQIQQKIKNFHQTYILIHQSKYDLELKKQQELEKKNEEDKQIENQLIIQIKACEELIEKESQELEKFKKNPESVKNQEIEEIQLQIAQLQKEISVQPQENQLIAQLQRDFDKELQNLDQMEKEYKLINQQKKNIEEQQSKLNNEIQKIHNENNKILDINSVSNVANTYDPNTGEMLAAFTQAAYCLPHKITKWKCGNPLNKGFTGYYEPLDAIIISWKGTIKIRQWLEDFDYFKTAYPYCDGCEVHKGFWQGWEGLQSYFWLAFNKLREAHPESKIYLTGHSLGAALSVFNAMDLIENGITDFVWYNFGQPRIGNKATADYIQKNLTNKLMRVTHHKDPVPHVPPEDFGFYHSTQEIFYVHSSDPNKEHIICSDSNGEDPNCSDKYKADIDVNDHVFYEGWDYVYNIGLCII